MRVWTPFRPLFEVLGRLGRLGGPGGGSVGGPEPRHRGRTPSARRTATGRRPLPGWRSIRGRVAVVITVPICLLLTVAGLAVYGRAEALGDARTTRTEVGLSLRVQALVHQLQRERGLTNGLLGGEKSYRTQLTATRERVDTALRSMRPEREVQDVIQRNLRRLAAVRAATDRAAAGKATADRTATLTFYTTAVDALNDVDPVADTASSADRQLRDGLSALRELAAAKESVALERGLLNGVFAEGAFHGREYLTFTEVRATRVAALARFREVASAPQLAELKRAFATKDAVRATTYEARAEGAPDGSALRVDAGAWWDVMTVLVDDLYDVQQTVGDDVRDRADSLSHDAELALAAYLLAGTLMATLVAGLAAFASRSLTRPLGALAEAAHDVARHRLPATVARIQQSPQDQVEFPEARPLGGAAEIAEVAESLRLVEHTALQLAAQQAVLRRNTTESLANLGRRNQNLVRRQLGLITRLERQEIDPDALAELFELDHLATRMRRNAESLLVLAGQNPPRPTAAPADGLEVVQSAVAEVEQYRRVLIAAVEPVRVRGHAVADVAHLLAELIENGLTFSPPTERVEVHGWYDTEDDTYSFAVVDHGVGMSVDDKERAARRLAGGGEDAFLAAPTRFLGHLVVGRLAHRLGDGAKVHLFDTPGGGLSALVVLPGRLLAPAQTTPSPTAPARSPRILPAAPVARPAVSALLNGFRAGVARAEARNTPRSTQGASS
ncbi:nitrate- and nitrite sensing domain-containing protein [Streptomyces sp. WI04-05B]|uniref:sensor histidine kinase n=1 Tax=Streptomyces TaxID=1883 RepID=UPI0029B92972|nr:MULTISPECIES: nitrate- and nitrite sensing domain-containing protein [unclassified Streptomyces]MDX2546154.1 nitrate- and nitrite sensing domain-containing protein [Streptomyces sp. WI04-05B]MDX2587156.1 nitrate- and nitrite sensing domain-containing protein [Streptomyces sp. WI04-05A]MDX3752687.1 nitrate- and nitrite sensing domain-containing protein [Streptomyces sp. AK08-02]